MLLRARILLPLSHPPLEDAAVRVTGQKIRAVGRWRDLAAGRRQDATDLGDVAVLPGFINAHCHLDYTDMAGRLPPQRSFTDWVKVITSAKAHFDLPDYRRSWLRGAAMLVQHGTTAVADVEAVPELLPEVWRETPLRVWSFLELTGILARRQPDQVVRAAVAMLSRLPVGRCRVGLAPHAPYSTRPELLGRCAAVARRRGWRLTTHVAESDEEFEMFCRGRGAMFEWLQRNQRVMDDCGGGSPVRHLARTGLLGPDLLAVHANYLAPGDADLLARHGVSVVHCPRSHRYFRHRPCPLRRLLRAGVNVCLGTDSLATVLRTPEGPPQLSLFAEMQELARREPWLRPRRIVQMATSAGARALGLTGRAGQITPGAWADLIAIPYAGNTREVWEAIVHHQGHVAASMIAGQWVVPPAG